MYGDLGSLAAAVIYQAWSDAGAGIVQGTRRADNDRDRSDAISFLTAAVGAWAQSRKHWAEIAGICPDQLRQRAMDVLPAHLTAVPPPAPRPERPQKPNAGSKLRSLAELLSRPEGVSAREMMERFGWARATCHSAMSYDLPRRLNLRATRAADGRYYLVQP